MGPLAGARRGSHFMEFHHQGVPKKARPLLGRGLGVASPSTKGYGCIEKYGATRPLFVPEEGSGLGKFLGMLL